MKRYLLVWSLSLAYTTALVAVPLSSVSARSSAHHVWTKAPTAPADEYFGHQKLSILGVRNTIHDLNIRYDGTVQRSSMVLSVGAGVEDAMHVWSKRYPGDLWLAHNAFQLDQVYMRVPTPEGRLHVKSMSDWLIRQYPHTYYGRYLSRIRVIAQAHAAAPFPVALGPHTVLPTRAGSSLEKPPVEAGMPSLPKALATQDPHAQETVHAALSSSQ